ncbi:MAG TPA: (d)CMP kinase [Erysipelothrix sp.]|nr:(d)CMP kinase [Erysipelothrix sp.]
MFNIAIDGPSASGKSTIAKQLAKKLGFIHIDTGAMYRAVAYDCIKKNIDFTDEKACIEIAKKSEIELLDNGEIFLNGINVTRSIRSNRVSLGASNVSKIKEVREVMVSHQQNMARKKGFVMDGRDITSVVLPDAEIKIYQTADVKVRAQRRFFELLEKGESVEFDAIYQELVERDYQDMNRAESPLIKVDDAVEIDTTYLSIEESVVLIMSLIKDRGLI